MAHHIFPHTCFIRYSHVNLRSSVRKSRRWAASLSEKVITLLYCGMSADRSIQHWLILWLFNDAFEALASNSWMIRMYYELKRLGITRTVAYLSYYPSVCVKGLKNTMTFSVTTAGLRAGIRTRDLTLWSRSPDITTATSSRMKEWQCNP
jgi:hypothetical protein